MVLVDCTYPGCSFRGLISQGGRTLKTDHWMDVMTMQWRNNIQLALLNIFQEKWARVLDWWYARVWRYYYYYYHDHYIDETPPFLQLHQCACTWHFSLRLDIIMFHPPPWPRSTLLHPLLLLRISIARLFQFYFNEWIHDESWEDDPSVEHQSLSLLYLNIKWRW